MLSVADSVITFHSPPITKIANHYHVYWWEHFEDYFTL
jgi:hypothetical protein